MTVAMGNPSRKLRKHFYQPTLGKSVRDPLYTKLIRSLLRLLTHPQNVVWVVTVQGYALCM